MRFGFAIVCVDLLYTVYGMGLASSIRLLNWDQIAKLITV